MNERKTREIMVAPAITSTMPEEVSPASPMKRDRTTTIDEIAEVKSTIFYDSWNEIILLEVLGENIEFV